ncbi:hypothetical protein HZS61_011435 [Fusarium oxysporum f. sp. conglutinans]|uniref:Zn(2)-C6 fungal-type domain-containing protein n=1 Tax=Fusarium oxysporum f. sp. conglutinans TaxID=100902 RepID=A0A8H6GY60_FUSOX|nr:hypothetical protein HZS61_011435 [Fusarium oxysporum f. sp. conglutinans]
MDAKQRGRRIHFRSILPRRTEDKISNDHVSTTTARTIVPRRRPVAIACNPCRERKIKCDAKEPACSSCMSRGKSCSYSTRKAGLEHWKQKYEQLRQESLDCRHSRDALQQLLRNIQHRSMTEAVAITQQLRDGLDVETVLCHIETGDVLLQLHLKPETKYRFSIPFGSDIPIYLQRSDNPYLQSMLYSTESSTLGARQHDGSHINERETPQYFKPYHAATVLDPRLDSIKPSTWTTVSNDDKLMKSLLHDYFLHEYEWLPFFHKDHFLDDMLSGAKNFCSSLLVNSVLAVSCVNESEKAGLVCIYGMVPILFVVHSRLPYFAATAM